MHAKNVAILESRLGGPVMSSSTDFVAFLARDAMLWRRLVKDSGAKAD